MLNARGMQPNASTTSGLATRVEDVLYSSALLLYPEEGLGEPLFIDVEDTCNLFYA